MLLELAGFFGGIIIVLLFLAETNKPIFGLFATVFLLVLGAWIIVDGIQYKIGESVLVHENGTSTMNPDNSSTIALFSNQTAVSIYQNVPETLPYISVNQFFGVVFILVSIYGIFHYVTKVSG